MGYRTFVDRDGSYWQVWDSQPSRVERRLRGSDRRNHKPFPWKGAERREEPTAYDQPACIPARRLWAGWLTFESLDESFARAIPSRWDELSQTELRQLCDKAKRIAKTEGLSSSG